MAEKIKTLTTAELEKLQQLEKKWGHCIIAYENGLNPADVTSEELNEVQALEKEIGAVLVDYQC